MIEIDSKVVWPAKARGSILRLNRDTISAQYKKKIVLDLPIAEVGHTSLTKSSILTSGCIHFEIENGIPFYSLPGDMWARAWLRYVRLKKGPVNVVFFHHRDLAVFQQLELLFNDRSAPDSFSEAQLETLQTVIKNNKQRD